MSQSTKTKQSEQLNIQENAENNPNKNYPLAEREPILGTPFTLIRDNEKWFMVMGDYRVTETTKTKEEQIDKLDTEKWLLIMHICIISVQKIQQEQARQIEADIKRRTEQNITSYETESLQGAP